MRLLFCSAQIPGHLDWGGYLKTAAELARRGHSVLWTSGAPMANRVTATGVPFQAVEETGWRWPPPPLTAPPTPEDPTWQQQRALRALDQWLDETRVSAAVSELMPIALAHQPDAIVSEPFVAAAGLVAEGISVPLLVAGWPAFAIEERSHQAQLAERARERLQRLTHQFDLQGVHWTPSGPPTMLSTRLHATFWGPGWYTGVALQPQTQHFGGSAPVAAAADRGLPPTNQLPWVLITLGTSFNNDPNFFLAAAHAAARLGCLPLIVLGRSSQPSDQAWLQRLPTGTAVRCLIAFDAVLPYLAAAIHHGGAGTTHALITRAVPQIVVPHAADQFYQAQGVARSGVGLHIPPKQVTIAGLEAALASLLPDLSDYRSRARQLQAEFAALGGAEAAADAIERNSL